MINGEKFSSEEYSSIKTKTQIIRRINIPMTKEQKSFFNMFFEYFEIEKFFLFQFNNKLFEEKEIENRTEK